MITRHNINYNLPMNKPISLKSAFMTGFKATCLVWPIRVASRLSREGRAQSA